MRMKSVISLFAVITMVLSLTAGIGSSSVSNAKVSRKLPKVTGLYKSDFVCSRWDDKSGKQVLYSDKDQYGNTVLTDEQGEYIRYIDQDNPEYLTQGVKQKWGLSMVPSDDVWFDYVDGNKVTHVNASKLKITKLDGSAYKDATIGSANWDSRVVNIALKSDKPFLLTYTGAKKNNKMIIHPNLTPNFYTSATQTAKGLVSGDIHVISGRSKDIYVHLTDNLWEGSRYIADPESALTMVYRDENDREIELKGAEAAKYATVSVVSDTDPHKMTYKISVKGIEPPSGDYFGLNFKYKEYDVNEGAESAYERSVYASVCVVDESRLGRLHVAFGNTIDYRNGKLDVVNEGVFMDNCILSGMVGSPYYLAFRYVDEEGKASYVTNPKDLTFFKDMINEGSNPRFQQISKTELNDIRISRPDPSSPVFRIVFPYYLYYHKIVIGYKKRVNDDHNIVFDLCASGGFSDAGVLFSNKDAGAWITEVNTDGKKPLTVYFGKYRKDYKSIDLEYCHLTDDKGNDLGDSVKINNAELNNKTKEDKFAYGNAITIPASSLKRSCILTVAYRIDTGDYDYVKDCQLYIIKTPKKGTKFTSGGITYVATSKDTVSVSKVKTTAKSVSIPNEVGTMWVTGIAANAMKGCKKLTRITLKYATVGEVGKGAFTGVPKKAVAYIPKSATKEYEKLVKKIFKKGGFKGKVKRT